MSIFSKVSRFHGAGQDPNENNVAQYGQPARSLFTELAPGSLHQKISVTDEQGKVLYTTKSSIIAIRGKTDIFDAAGSLTAHIEKKIVSLHEKRFISMADGQKFTLSNELFHIVRDITNIEELGWQIRGNVIGLNFTLFDQTGEPIAAIGQKIASIHDRYSIDIYQPQHEKITVAIVIALQKMMTERRENSN